MARIRSIKPDFWTDEKIVELSAFARLLFIGLWNFADDEGRMVFSEKKIKMQVFPADTLNISELFGEIRGKKLIEIYSESRRLSPTELVNNPSLEEVLYIQIVNFTSHQKIDKRQKSKLPPKPPAPPESPRISTTDQGMDQGEEGKRKKESQYRFAGSIIKLSEEDFQKFKTTYHGIPDLDAELRAADSHYLEKPPGEWFPALGNRLNARHQGLLAKKPPPKPDPNFRAGARAIL